MTLKFAFIISLPILYLYCVIGDSSIKTDFGIAFAMIAAICAYAAFEIQKKVAEFEVMEKYLHALTQRSNLQTIQRNIKRQITTFIIKNGHICINFNEFNDDIINSFVQSSNQYIAGFNFTNNIETLHNDFINLNQNLSEVVKYISNNKNDKKYREIIDYNLRLFLNTKAEINPYEHFMFFAVDINWEMLKEIIELPIFQFFKKDA